MVEATPVPSCVATTVTPGSTAPLSSVTRPTITPVSICANAEVSEKQGQAENEQANQGAASQHEWLPERVAIVPEVYARYFRMESILSFPEPTAAKYRKMKQ